MDPVVVKAAAYQSVRSYFLDSSMNNMLSFVYKTSLEEQTTRSKTEVVVLCALSKRIYGHKHVVR